MNPIFFAPSAAKKCSVWPRTQWRGASKVLGLGLAVLMGASGCLSDRYRITDDELARQVQLPPEQRGQNLRVVQRIGSREAPAVAPAPPQQAYGPGNEQGYPPGYYDSQPQVGVFVGVNVGPSYGPGYSSPPRGGGGAPVMRAGPSGAPAGPARAAPGGAAAPAPAPQSGYRGGSGSSSSSSSSKSNSTDSAEAMAVLVVLAAVAFTVGAAATEGARYDGNVNITPYQNIYLKDRSGAERVQALGDLSPRDLIGVRHGEISDAEGYGLQRLGRAPLNREGFAFKLDLGSFPTRLDDSIPNGAGANIQFGYFFNKKLGLLATTNLSGGEDRLGRSYLRTQFGGELQGFLPGLGPLHFGGFGHGGVATTAIDNAGSSSGNVVGAGGILELELTTRLSFMFRVGWSWSTMGGQGWRDDGLGLSGGLAIY